MADKTKKAKKEHKCPPSGPCRKRRRRLFSRLRLRILTVNAIPMIVLLLGILYLGQYEKGLIEAELKTLEHQTKLYAGAIAETAIRPQAVPSFTDDPMAFEVMDRLSAPIAKRLVQRLGEMTEGRIRAYDVKGIQIADSDQLVGSGGLVRSMPLEPIIDHDLKSLPYSFFGFLADHIPSVLNVPNYPEMEYQKAFPGMVHTLNGLGMSKAWKTEQGGVILTAAAPIQSLKQVLGAVYITQDGSSIKDALRDVTINILSIFGATIAVTFILSFYLAAGIANPLKKLSNASVQVRQGKINAEKIPDFSRRKDEIGDLSVALHQMTVGLAERIDSIERFAADVAHELKNPLTSLRSAVETATIVSTDKDRERMFGIIKHDVQRLNRLISDISNASRLDAELAREAMGVVDMRVLFEHIESQVLLVTERRKEEFGRKLDVDFNLDLPSKGDILVQGIESRLGQIFLNLVDNAVSFVPEDGKVRITAEKDGPRWVFQVEDNGPGIPENKIGTIFERFYSERPDREEFGEHSGLGLSISKQIIDAHDGQLYADNIYDAQGQKSGARFTVILNVAK